MRTRIIAGAIAIPIFVIPIWLGGIFVLLLGLTVTILAVMEFYFMADAGGYKPIRLIGVPMAIVLFLSGWNPDDVQRSATTITGVLQAPTRLIVEWVSYPTVSVLTLGLIFMLIYALFVHDHPLSSFMSTAMGAIYIGVLMSQIVALRFWDNGLWYVLWGLLVTWANDTFAYFIGVTMGRHKLWPRLSPKKTWEGTIGGWLGAAVVGSLLAVAMPLPIGYIFGAIVGFLAGVLALFGDLAVSMMKRQVGIKDSGTLFPGHGGMLDRLDSLLFTLPFIYQMVFLFGR